MTGCERMTPFSSGSTSLPLFHLMSVRGRTKGALWNRRMCSSGSPVSSSPSGGCLASKSRVSCLTRDMRRRTYSPSMCNDGCVVVYMEGADGTRAVPVEDLQPIDFARDPFLFRYANAEQLAAWEHFKKEKGWTALRSSP